MFYSEACGALAGDEVALSGRRGPTKLGFALLLGRFPRGRHELPAQAVDYVARSLKIPAEDLALYEWDGRTVKDHRTEIRKYFGFRECSVADSDKAADWLAPTSRTWTCAWTTNMYASTARAAAFAPCYSTTAATSPCSSGCARAPRRTPPTPRSARSAA